MDDDLAEKLQFGARLETAATVQTASALDVHLFDSMEFRLLAELRLDYSKSNVVITSETRPFRFLAKNLEFIDYDGAVDLGCSTGETTQILSKRFVKSIGFDIGEEVVLKGKEEHPGLDLRVLDVLSDREALLQLIETEYGGKTPVFFVDIGGDRMQNIVILFASYLLERFPKCMLVIKSRKLYRHLLERCETSPRVEEMDWSALVKETLEEEVRNRKCFHPQRYHLRLAPDSGLPICRYHNYSVCKKGEECRQDHVHCHHCLANGHRGAECPLWATEPIVRKKVS